MCTCSCGRLVCGAAGRTALVWHMSTSSSINLQASGSGVAGIRAACRFAHFVGGMTAAMLIVECALVAHRGTCAKWKPCRSDFICSGSTTSNSNSTPAAARAMRSGSARPAESHCGASRPVEGDGGGGGSPGNPSSAYCAAGRLLARCTVLDKQLPHAGRLGDRPRCPGLATRPGDRNRLSSDGTPFPLM